MISQYFTEVQLEIIEKLVDNKVFPNRSEAIRALVNRGLEVHPEYQTFFTEKEKLERLYKK